jgi:hypothetical protein
MELANELRTAWAESDFGESLMQPVADASEGSDPDRRYRPISAFHLRAIASQKQTFDRPVTDFATKTRKAAKLPVCCDNHGVSYSLDAAPAAA